MTRRSWRRSRASSTAATARTTSTTSRRAIAFSWDVTGKDRTFLRGGWGIMNGRFPSTNAFAEVQAAGWRSYEVQNPGNATAEELRNMVIRGTVPLRPNITLVATDIKTPQTMQASFGVGQVLTDELVLNLDYLDQQGRDLYVNYNANPLIPSTNARQDQPELRQHHGVG